MQNTIYSLENIFAINVFRIPQYQRAYSWEVDPQLEAFLEDLRQQVSTQKKSPNKQYFLGTFLLHEEDIGGGRTVVNIVDGQQRMTTSVVFIATALALAAKGKISLANEKPALLKRSFVFDEAAECQKFHTIEEDDPFFQSAILGFSAATSGQDSPSSRRLNAAAEFFTKAVAREEWDSLVHALKTAKVMVYAVDSAEDATQIFELQNERQSVDQSRSAQELPDALRLLAFHEQRGRSAQSAADAVLKDIPHRGSARGTETNT
jgi:hypothetical protein